MASLTWSFGPWPLKPKKFLQFFLFFRKCNIYLLNSTKFSNEKHHSFWIFIIWCSWNTKLHYFWWCKNIKIFLLLFCHQKLKSRYTIFFTFIHNFVPLKSKKFATPFFGFKCHPFWIFGNFKILNHCTKVTKLCFVLFLFVITFVCRWTRCLIVMIIELFAVGRDSWSAVLMIHTTQIISNHFKCLEYIHHDA